MKNLKHIENLLKQKGILNYKIIQISEKSLIIKDISENLSINEFNIGKVLVLIKTQNGVSKFSVSSMDSDIINTLIDDAIENANDVFQTWDGYNFVNTSMNKDKYLFENFNSEEYLLWIKNEIKKIKSATNLPFNTVYTVKLFQDKLLSDSGMSEQYRIESEYVCMENISFRKKAILKNVFINEDLLIDVINRLNQKLLDFKSVNLDDYKNILIKKEALSSILNVYIKAFYADSVYAKQSFIKREDINKVIVSDVLTLEESPFDGIYFDGEGTKSCSKKIIKNGVLINLLNNNTTSNYLKIKNYGNTCFDNIDLINHQMLKIKIKRSLDSLAGLSYITICKFESLYLDFTEKSFNGIAVLEVLGDTFYSMVKISAIDIFNNIYKISNNYEQVDNVYCTDIIVKR